MATREERRWAAARKAGGEYHQLARELRTSARDDSRRRRKQAQLIERMRTRGFTWEQIAKLCQEPDAARLYQRHYSRGDVAVRRRT